MEHLTGRFSSPFSSAAAVLSSLPVASLLLIVCLAWRYNETTNAELWRANSGSVGRLLSKPFKGTFNPVFAPSSWVGISMSEPKNAAAFLAAAAASIQIRGNEGGKPGRGTGRQGGKKRKREAIFLNHVIPRNINKKAPRPCSILSFLHAWKKRGPERSEEYQQIAINGCPLPAREREE